MKVQHHGEHWGSRRPRRQEREGRTEREPYLAGRSDDPRFYDSVASSRVRAEREAVSPISRMQSRELSLGADEGSSGGVLSEGDGVRCGRWRGWASPNANFVDLL